MNHLANCMAAQEPRQILVVNNILLVNRLNFFQKNLLHFVSIL